MNDNQFIDNNNLYNIKNNNYNKISSFPQRMKAKNQLIPSIYPNKANNSLSQRYFNYNFNNSYEIENNYYTNNNKNMLNNNVIGKYNNPQNYNIDEYNNNENDIGNYYIPNNNYNINKKQNSSISINIEDLMVLEEKLSEIIFFLKNREEVKNQCFDFWNYYYNCSLYQRIEKTFKIENKIEIVKLSINLELLSVMLCYEFSFDHKILNKTYILLLEVLELNYRNLMIICENILTKITAENQKNRWVLKLRKIVQNSKMTETGNYQNISYADKIGINTDKINKKLLNILLNYQTEYSPLIMSLMKKITQKNYEEINDFFREYILKVENLESSIVASILLNTNPNFVSHRPPYLHSPRAKSYTLILDLNETLVSFQQTNYSQGILRLRPFLIEFLEEISYYYELILFTASTEYFAKPIINAIEENKKYFDYVFYRECCIIIGNDFVKDLTRIGRPLDSTIIVDNMPQNFKLQKENGINIKSFYAQDPNDSALYNLLPILIDIAEDEVDVREGLAKYRNEIVKSVTSNISKYNI
jgi:CTD small phosphatase-like protein 2